MPYISIPPPHEPFVEEDGKVSEIWYRYLNENLGRINSVTTINSGTTVATTGGTAVTFTGIPPGVNRVTVDFSLVGLTTPGTVLVQLGAPGGYQSTGYRSNSIEATTAAIAGDKSTAGFAVLMDSSALGYAGYMQFIRRSSEVWIATHVVGTSTYTAAFGGGQVALFAGIDSLRIILADTVNNAFRTGKANIHWEF
jgi:hypothetical protein